MDNDRLDSSIYAAFFNMEHLPFERDLPVDSLCKRLQIILITNLSGM